MKAIRETRPVWQVMGMERNEYGIADGMLQPGFFWDEQEAVAERERLQRLRADSHIRYVVIEGEASVVYPDDEPPPWAADLDWKKRGYEQPPDQ